LEYQQIIHIPGNLLNKICLEPQYLLFAHAYTERKRPTTRTYALHKKKSKLRRKIRILSAVEQKQSLLKNGNKNKKKAVRNQREQQQIGCVIFQG